jgi:beta-glucosidase
VDAVRAQAKGKPELGMVWNLDPAWPLDEAKAEDVEAARRAWSYKNDWWLSPVYRGCYPEEGWAQRGVDVPDVQKGDLEQIARPLDWTGHNFYFPIRYTADPASALKFKQVPKPEGLPANALGWEVNPSGLLTLLNEFTRRYGRMPIFISENGYCGFHESPEADGCVHDPSRVEYLRHHLQACQAALRAGVDLRGYYAWSLLDNFEWSAGYKPQFGLVHVDRGTQARTLKDSAKWYKGFIATHSLGPQEALRDALAPETGRA